jgi:hypothetical protein
MKPFILRIGVSLITLALGMVTSFVWKTITPWQGGRNASETLRLHVHAETTTFKLREEPDVQVTITNTGSETVTLVLPGDGSGWGARTPAVNWSIVPLDERARNAPSNELRILGCGNMDQMRWEEIFTLAPGETKTFKVSLPWLRGPGVYRVAFHYTNRPGLGGGGRSFWYNPLDGNALYPLAVWRARYSTECALVSNEIVVTVTE